MSPYRTAQAQPRQVPAEWYEYGPWEYAPDFTAVVWVAVVLLLLLGAVR